MCNVDLFISGNDAGARKTVSYIVGGRGTEHYLPLWIRLWDATGTPFFEFKNR